MRLRVVVLVVGLLVVGACGGDDEGRPAAGGEGTVVEVPALDGPSVPDALATGEEELVEMLREPVLDALGAEAESGRARLEELDGQRRQDAAAAIAVLAPAGAAPGRASTSRIRASSRRSGA
ncbi:MAG: hypothetical protein M5U14_05325 [Acidimicrobiia bacterium]|nr:hypothetical protein [Acidimicrobiia bacterium]